MKNKKSAAARYVLRMMDKDFLYSFAIKFVVATFKVDRDDLESELNNYV